MEEVLRLIDGRIAELAPMEMRSSLTRARLEELRELRRKVEGLGGSAPAEQP